MQATTEQMLDAIEAQTGKRFAHRREIGLLYELSEQHGKKTDFHELTFHAKFVTNASRVLARMGDNIEEASKLAGEYGKAIEKATAVLRGILAYASPEVQKEFAERVLRFTFRHLDAILSLFAELARVQNYFLDQDRSAE